jgi:hypothetical protein
VITVQELQETLARLPQDAEVKTGSKSVEGVLLVYGDSGPRVYLVTGQLVKVVT